MIDVTLSLGIQKSPGCFSSARRTRQIYHQDSNHIQGEEKKEKLHMIPVTASVTEKQVNILTGTFYWKNCLLLSSELLYVHLISNIELKGSSALPTLAIGSGILGTSVQWAETVITSSVPVRNQLGEQRSWMGKALRDGRLTVLISCCLFNDLWPYKLCRLYGAWSSEQDRWCHGREKGTQIFLCMPWEMKRQGWFENRADIWWHKLARNNRKSDNNSSWFVFSSGLPCQG